MTTIPSGSIANYYCPLNHNSHITTRECKELGNSYCMDKPPFLVIPCLPAAVRKNTLLLPFVIYYFCGENKDNNLGRIHNWDQSFLVFPD